MKHVRRLPELTTKGKILVGLSVFVVVAVIGTFVVTSMVARLVADTKDSVGIPDFTKKDASSRKSDALTTANSVLEGGDKTKAATIYERAIAAEPDPTKKVKLAIDYSSLLSENGDVNGALNVAKEAESYSTDKYLIADRLGQLYAKSKQYSEAARYFALAGSLASSPTNDKGYNKKHYDDIVIKANALAEKK